MVIGRGRPSSPACVLKASSRRSSSTVPSMRLRSKLKRAARPMIARSSQIVRHCRLLETNIGGGPSPAFTECLRRRRLSRAGRRTPLQSLGVHIRPGLTVPAFPLTRILVVTDAWLPQVNGVVRAIETLVREAPALGVEIEILAADGFRTVPLPTYPQLRVAVTRPNAVRRRIEELKPDFIHSATEGPLGLCAWFACRRAGRPFTTCYHTRFPEYLAARRVAPSRFVYALLRRFHNAGSGMMVSTETLGRELGMRGFVRLMRWSHGVDCIFFDRVPQASSNFPDRFS